MSAGEGSIKSQEVQNDNIRLAYLLYNVEWHVLPFHDVADDKRAHSAESNDWLAIIPDR